MIQDLQNQLQQIRRAHTHMVKAYEGKLAEFVIPVEELGFDPLVPTSVDWDWLWLNHNYKNINVYDENMHIIKMN